VVRKKEEVSPPVKQKKKRISRKPPARGARVALKPGDVPLLRAEEYYKAIENRKGVGAPGWIPTKEIAAEIERLASMGMLLKNIAQGVGVSYDTWCIKRREYPELQESIDRGYKIHETRHLRALDNVAENGAPGAVQASIFKLKASHKYRDNDAAEDKDGNTRTPESIAKTILAAIRRLTE